MLLQVRLTLTIVDPATDQRADVVLEGDGETPVSAVADAFDTLLGRAECAAAGLATLYVDGRPLAPGATLHGSVLREGTLVSIGDPAGCANAEFAPSGPADAAVEPSADGTSLDYNRPPRLLPPLRQTRFRLPGRPVDQERRPLPIVMAVVPLVMSVVMASVFHRWYMLLFGFMSPLALVGSHFYDRKVGRKSHRKKLADYRETRAAIEEDAKSALLAERTARRAALPDPATVLLTAIGPRRRLWERRRHDADVLTIRVGMGDVDSEVVLDDPDQLEHKREQTWRALDVPVTVALRERGVLGFAGPDDFPRAMARWAVAQSAALHSPADLWIYVLTDVQGRESWKWVRWLPHARPAVGQDTLVLIGADADSTSRRVSELVQIVAARSDTSRGAVGDGPDILVVLDGARRLRSLPGIVQVLRVGPSVGVYSVCVDEDERLLPEECQAVVVQEASGVRVQQTRTAAVHDVRPDTVSARWCDRFARALAPMRDISGDAEDDALPSSSRLLDALGLEPPTGDAIAARWARGGRSTETLLGESRDGPFRIDLRRDGPHGLIAGTTGAGKSELLQSLVASLAVANRPDALTFVLIDYKGGAAFAHCERLPHTVGLVTDLDTHLVERALASLGAELRRRERQLASAGAKDIDDYADLLTRDSTLPALPRLVIVVDEFASMARELPDFVTGMVDIAQRGRSLGIHLILATQRPSGVVSPEIRANTNLRIALRVTDASESSDVIDAPDAGRITKSTPGRAYARLGHSSLVAFQTSRIGGRRPGTASRDALRPWVTEADWTSLGRPAPVRPRQPTVADAEITDLQVLVEQIRAAAAALDVPAQHSPWLAALPENLLLAEIERAAPAVADPGALPVAAFALEDVPAEQARRAAVIDLAHFDHLYVVGAPRSGRSQALRTIAGSLARACCTADLHLYGIDCGNGALLPLADLPQCGAVVQRTQTERATRLVLRLAAEVRRRQGLLADGGFADLSEQRAAVAVHDRLPHVVVLLDRWEGFTTTLGEVDGGRLTEEVYVMLREGASVGVHLVLSGDRSLVVGRMGTFTDAKLVLRLPDRTDFSLAGINPRSVPDDLPAGRGFRSESGVETHVALLDADATAVSQAAALTAIAADAKVRDAAVPRARRPFRVDVLPARLPFDQAWDLRVDTADRPLWALVGVGGDELAAQGPELRSGARSFVVAGPPRSGRSTVLVTMARSLLAAGTSVVLATPRSSPLRDLDGTVGVRAVFTGCDIPALELAAALESGGAPCVVLVDDAELLRECDAADVLRSVMRSGDERPLGLVIAGGADDICTGFSGWQVEVKKSRQGTLLSPQGTTDGELIGVRLPRSVVGGTVVPGRALLHLGDTLLHTVQVPFPVAPAARVG
jgi:S-DNA-T family DNA segregation ATPase FtsK/SpoIIIE